MLQLISSIPDPYESAMAAAWQMPAAQGWAAMKQARRRFCRPVNAPLYLVCPPPSPLAAVSGASPGNTGDPGSVR